MATRDSATGLQRRVVSELGADIAGGRLAPGTVLAPEELGRRFGVSRTIVREAFRALEARGLITARPRIGTTVAPAESWNLLDPQVISWRGAGAQAARQLEELLVLREAVEPAAAALAAVHASDDELRELAASCDAMEAGAAARDPFGFIDADGRFHRVLVQSSGNAVLAQLLDTVEATLTRRYATGPALFTDATTASLARHRALADAVAARDTDAAETASAALVRAARDEVAQASGEPGAAGTSPAVAGAAR